MPGALRRISAILFIALLFFNVLGYYGVFVGLQYTHDREVIRRLNADNYKESETITIRIPLTIPYAVDSRGFERVDGKFEYRGVFYRMVKQRLAGDTLLVVCLKDPQSKQINEAFISLVKTFVDRPTDNKENSKSFSCFIKDYFAHPFSIIPWLAGWQCDVVKNTCLTNYVSDFFTSIIHPPERFARIID